MAEDQRQHRTGRRDRTGVQEVDPEPAERDAEVGVPGQSGLLGRPIELFRPVVDEFTQVAKVGPERPPDILRRVRPAGGPQSSSEIVDSRRCGPQSERLGAWWRARHERHPTRLSRKQWR